MINNPNWLKPKEKPYFHQISLNCIEELAEYIESNDIEEIDCDTCLIMQEILSDEIDDTEFLEFAIDNIDDLFSHIIEIYTCNGSRYNRSHLEMGGYYIKTSKTDCVLICLYRYLF